MRFGRSRRLRSVPKNTGTTAQSLDGAAPAPAGGAAPGATERVVGRSAASPSPPLVTSSLLAPTLGGVGGGPGDPTGGGGGDDTEGAGGGSGKGADGDDAEGAGADDTEGADGDDAEGAGADDTEGAGGGDGEGAGDVPGDVPGDVLGDVPGDPTAGPAGSTDRFMAKVLRLGCAPVGAGGGAEAVLGDGAIGRAVGADPTGGATSLAKVGRL